MYATVATVRWGWAGWVLAFGCATGGEEVYDGAWDTDWTSDVRDVRDFGYDAPDASDARPDGLGLDVPLPDGYGTEIAETADGCGIRNSCGGCSRLRAEPGTACGGCDGVYECAGPDSVRCVGGCSPIGCSDMQREGFLSIDTWPEIAACSGGFTVAGVFWTDPQCSRGAGDDSRNPSGSGCSIADLCAEGWRPCASPAEVRDRTDDRGCDIDWPAGMFFAARVSGPAGADECGIGTNDFYGCGSAGGGADRGTCAPLTRSSGEKCRDIPPPWDCEDTGVVWQYDEAARVVKPGPGGGVLCCLAPG